MELKDKIALVTGGGQGIGRGIALGLAKEGAIMAVNDYSLDRAEKTAQEIVALDRPAIAIQANVADAKEVVSMVNRVKGEWGRIDILVNNAGIAQTKMVEDMDKADWDSILDVNLGGVFNCSKAVIATMKSQGAGKIVSISSMAGKRMSYRGELVTLPRRPQFWVSRAILPLSLGRMV